MTLKKNEVVAAMLPLQDHWLPLSNLDLLLPPIDVGVFFCYQKPAKLTHVSFSSVVGTLKTSLAQVLVSFYAFAGEIVTNSEGEPELLCNNRGVDFIEAFVDIELRELDLYNPDASVEGTLVPKKKDGVLCVQATELRCGGIVVGCTFDHRIADAYSANMFFVAWAETAQSKSISVHPSFRCSMLNPRHPGFYDASINDMYVPVSSLPPPEPPKPGTDFTISRIYYVTAEDLAHLQATASAGGYRRSKLESLSAYLWQVVAKASVRESHKRCKMGIVVDGRTRLSEDESMSNYFGNVLSIPFGEGSAKELTEKPLSWTADVVHEFLEKAVNKEHFLGLIDWVQEQRPKPAMAKIYCEGSEDGPAFVMSSGQSFPVRKVDFGWGKPVMGSYHFPWGGDSGYVMPMPSARGNGDWLVYAHLMKGQLGLLEAEAGSFFRRFTAEHLNIPATASAGIDRSFRTLHSNQNSKPESAL
ncbi:coniferyl alcohol acyltransferase-like [Aristolochia californica]|uniref:coniferyl alcohol acyltransferase-like n=1 Tax=Aristolochia californica TaxID=171875 RepID=UPI0035DB3CB9